MRPALKAPSSEATNKLLGLEALRFLTAFAILVFHYRHFAFVADKPVDLVPERLPLYGLLQVFHDFGSVRRLGVLVHLRLHFLLEVP